MLITDPTAPDEEAFDVCQDTFAEFFNDCAEGEIDLQDPDELMRLLIRLARKRIGAQARKRRAKKRLPQSEVLGEGWLQDVLDPGKSPSQKLALSELVERVKRIVTGDEWRIVQLRIAGWQWDMIAIQVGGQQDAVRQKFNRTMDRVAGQLGMIE